MPAVRWDGYSRNWSIERYGWRKYPLTRTAQQLRLDLEIIVSILWFRHRHLQNFVLFGMLTTSLGEVQNRQCAIEGQTQQHTWWMERETTNRQKTTIDTPQWTVRRPSVCRNDAAAKQPAMAKRTGWILELSLANYEASTPLLPRIHLKLAHRWERHLRLSDNSKDTYLPLLEYF